MTIEKSATTASNDNNVKKFSSVTTDEKVMNKLLRDNSKVSGRTIMSQPELSKVSKH